MLSYISSSLSFGANLEKQAEKQKQQEDQLQLTRALSPGGEYNVLTKIDLGGQGLTILPPEIGLCVKVKLLNLTNNRCVHAWGTHGSN